MQYKSIRKNNINNINKNKKKTFISSNLKARKHFSSFILIEFDISMYIACDTGRNISSVWGNKFICNNQD